MTQMTNDLLQFLSKPLQHFSSPYTVSYLLFSFLLKTFASW